MGNSSFKENLFQLIQQNQELTKAICLDSSASDIFSWIRPNKFLSMKCARFIKKGKITNKPAVANEISVHAKTAPILCKIIGLTWLDKNQSTVNFINTDVTEDVIKDLVKGVYGAFDKIKILSFIDPRNGVEQVYEKYFSECTPKAVKNVKESEEKASADSEKMKQELANAVQQARSAKDALTEAKASEKELKKLLENKTTEHNSLLKTHSETAEQLKKIISENADLSIRLKNAEAKLSSALKENDDLNLKLSGYSDSNAKPDLSLALEEALRERDSLKQSLENRNSTISRYEKEISDMKKVLNNISSDKESIKNLQEKLAHQESTINYHIIPGQLISDQLFVSIHDEAHKITKEIVKMSKVIPEEYCLLYLDNDKKPIKLVSSETELKQEIIGIIHSNQGSFYLEPVNQEKEETYSIFSPIELTTIGRAVRGIFLPEAGPREAGIYATFPLKDTMSSQTGIRAHKTDKTTKNNSDGQLSTFKFNGEKVLIIGGDRVGHDYENSLEKYNLNIKWRSGFESIQDLRSGLANYDVILVIIKQMSHTLLREISAAAVKAGKPLHYSSRRGVSGVLDHLKKIMYK